MYTIFLDGKGNGARATGLGYNQFLETFDAICQEHVRESRAQAFAFVFYDMNHGPIRSALKSSRGFEILNAETGNEITLFYLHAAATKLHADTFNLHFMRALGIAEQITLPGIVFFRVNADQIDDISFNCIDDQVEDEHLIIEAMRRDIAKYITIMNSEGDISALTKVAGWFSKTAFILALKHIL